jgi:hypothetical protein
MVTLVLVCLLSMAANISALSASGATAAMEPQQASTAPMQPPSREAEEIRGLVAVGQNVWITDDQGRHVEGRIGTFGLDRLTVVSGRDSTELPYGSILRIDSPKDGLGNGALRGLGIGAGVGLAWIIAEDSRECDPAEFFQCGDVMAAAYVVIPLMTGGIGAAIGVLIDAATRREQNIYQRGPRVGVIPTLDRGRTGAAVALSW